MQASKCVKARQTGIFYCRLAAPYKMPFGACQCPVEKGCRQLILGC